MQSGDQIKEVLASALGASNKIQKTASRCNSDKNSFSLSSDVDSPGSGFQKEADKSTNPATSTQSKFSANSNYNKNKQPSPDRDLLRKQLSLNSKRNPISEGPLRSKRSTAVKRSQQESQQFSNQQRPRLFSQDLIEFQNMKIKQAKMFRNRAYELHESGDYFDSLTQLHKAVKTFKIEQLSVEVRQENEQVYNIIKDCYLFSASCYIKIHEYNSAIQLMNELLAVEADNFKALYLRGKAYYIRNEYQKAYQDFKVGLELEPENKIIQNHVQEIETSHPEIKAQYDQLTQSFLPPQQDENDKQDQYVPQRKFFSFNSTNSSESHKSEKGPLNQLAQTPKLNNEFSKQHPSSPSKIIIEDDENFTSNIRKQSGDSDKRGGEPKMSILDYIQQFWKQHKPEVIQMIMTIALLIAIFVIKRILKRVIPQQIQDKIAGLFM